MLLLPPLEAPFDDSPSQTLLGAAPPVGLVSPGRGDTPETPSSDLAIHLHALPGCEKEPALGA